MDTGDKRFRFDYNQKIISFDQETGKITGTIYPNPDRYRWIDKDGKRLLKDTFDNLLFPEELVYQMLEAALMSIPNDPQPHLLQGNAFQYYEERFPIVYDLFISKSFPINLSDKSEVFLESLTNDKLNFVIISIDIVGSTHLSTLLNPEDYSFVISLILYELSDLIPKFHGHVLKYTGDGLIAYFPEPSFITKNDLAIDCALTLRGLVYNVINPILQINEYPQINIRIGLDAGEAYVKVIGSPETKQHKDIIGCVVSISAKIQAKAEAGKIYMGETVERNLHTNWRKFCTPVKIEPELWNYKGIDGNIYKIYEINIE